MDIPQKEAVENIKKGYNAISQAIGSTVHIPFIRFPHFESSETLDSIVRDMALITFRANIITNDQEIKDSKELLEHALQAVENKGRGIVLFHDTQSQTADMLEEFLVEITDRGYHTVIFRPKETLAYRSVKHGIRMGAFFFELKPYSSMKEIAIREYNIYTMPAFFRIVHPDTEIFDFSLPDAVLDVAPPGVVIRGHALIECGLLPDWLEDTNLAGEELRNILITHVTTVVNHFRVKYPGRVVAWNVINEPFSYEGNICPWNRIGIEAGLNELEYIRIALETAHAADPGVKLYLNDFFIEGIDEKSDKMYELVSKLKQDGVPIHGIGLQSHFHIGTNGPFYEIPPIEEIVSNMDRFAALDLEIAITEADFSIKDSDLSTEALYEQAKDYRQLLCACIQAERCVAFQTWNIGDKDSWIPT